MNFVSQHGTRVVAAPCCEGGGSFALVSPWAATTQQFSFRRTQILHRRAQWVVVRENNTHSQRGFRRVQLPCFVSSLDRRWRFF
jgi:hypothetical protein